MGGVSVLVVAKCEDRAVVEGSGFQGRKSWLGVSVSSPTSPSLHLLPCRIERRCFMGRILLRIPGDNPFKTLSTHSHLLLLIIEFAEGTKKTSLALVHCCDIAVPTFILCSRDKPSCIQL